MNREATLEHLRLPPEQVRLALLYPELPNPIPFAGACPLGPWDEDEGDPPELRGCFFIAFDLPSLPSMNRYAVTAQHHRIVEEYDAASWRQYDAEEACAAARWEKRFENTPPPRNPEPEDIPPDGKLMPRQEEFCRHYAAQPVGTRAAVLAGYSEDNAAAYGSRLLKNPLVLDRIAKLRAEKQIHYVVEPDTVHDKLEAVFFEALGERNHAAAVAALRLQATLAGIMPRNAPAGAGAAGKKANKSQDQAPKKAKESQGGGARKAKESQAGPAPKAKKGQEKPRKAKGFENRRV